METYNTHSRRRYIRNQSKKYELGLKGQWSLVRIGRDVQNHYSLDKPPAPATIRNDLHFIEKDGVREAITPEANRLLEPDNFPEWRRTMFRAPGNKEYETPKHQLSWFYLVRALALKESPPEWVIEYLGLEEALHGIDITEWVEDPDQMLSLFLLAPPRHGKSDLAAHVIIWLICRNPDIRILWCGGKLDISELTTSFVKGELEANEKLIEYYGPFETEGSWSSTSFTVATRKTRMRSPTLRAVSKGATILSLDADMIFLDDVVDQKASESPAQVQKDVRWIKSQLMTRREPWTPMFGIGSHQPVPLGDLYEYLDSEHDNEIYFIKQRAHDYTKCLPLEDTMEEADRHGEHCLLWNSVRNWSYLEQFRRSLGDISFEVVYNQDSRQSTLEYFRDSVVRGEYPQPVIDTQTGRYREFNAYEQKAGILDRNRSFGAPVVECCNSRSSLRTVLGFDPASSQSAKASESALFVEQICLLCARRYVVDIWHKRQSPELHPETIAQHAAWYEVQRVRIEINAYQRALARDPRLREAAQLNSFVIDEWRTGDNKYDVNMGIPLLSRNMEEGKLSVPYRLPQDQQKAEPFLTQLIRYPAEPTDIIMAFWLADLSASNMLKFASYTKAEVFEDFAPSYLKDETFVIPSPLSNAE